jgi:hypothetical protein
MREHARARGNRHLVEQHLVVTEVNGDTVRAICRGSGTWHHCGLDMARGWWCECAVRTDQCSHLHALRAVTIRRKTTR